MSKVVQIKKLEFEIGFWHPFGPHAGETAEEIIKRKQKEIEKNGWTLWSFQFRKNLSDWFDEINKANPKNVLVFCSKGKGAKEPKSKTKLCSHYTPVDNTEPIKIPSRVKIPHPMGKRTKGSAFIVKRIIYPIPDPIYAPSIEWIKKGQWQVATLPTRPEYLIRAGKGQPTREFRAILELRPPYLAEVSVQ